MLEHFKREREIRNALRAIARQRVALVLQPGNVIVVERSPPDEEWFDLAVRTCHIRGWVEILHDAMPSGRIRNEGTTPILPEEMKPKTVYRLTEGGWSVINRSHGWLMATFTVGLLSLFAGIASVVVALATSSPVEQAAGRSPAAGDVERSFIALIHR